MLDQFWLTMIDPIYSKLSYAFQPVVCYSEQSLLTCPSHSSPIEMRCFVFILML